MTISYKPIEEDESISTNLSILHSLISDNNFLRKTNPKSSIFYDRRPQLDPLILETASLSSPYQTRNHYLHEYFPHAHNRHTIINEPTSPLSTTSTQSETNISSTLPSLSHLSSPTIHQNFTRNSSRNSSLDHSIKLLQESLQSSLSNPDIIHQENQPHQPFSVKCQARTRIPTVDGHLWLHLYTNTKDDKEHLAFVIDQEQLSGPPNSNWIRSTSLNQPWNEDESEIDRLVRGAHVDKSKSSHQYKIESSSHQNPYHRNSHLDKSQHENEADHQSFKSLSQVPIVRIHSECFTGETIGSQRCDCGEQLSESIRYIFNNPPYKGAVIYLRQEGRGIGLLNKIKAYNLQELGFDTLESNVLLGFGADLRDYLVALKILNDLNLGQIRLMTNNPNKIEALETNHTNNQNEDHNHDDDRPIQILQRIPMIPKQWQSIHVDDQSRVLRGLKHRREPIPPDYPQDHDSVLDSDQLHHFHTTPNFENELDIYLRTKVNRMRHLIPLPNSFSPVTNKN